MIRLIINILSIFQSHAKVTGTPIRSLILMDNIQIFDYSGTRGLHDHARRPVLLPIGGLTDYRFIQITLNAGRTVEVKKAFYKAIADGIHEKTGIRKKDVWINLVDVNLDDWSFGGDEMQYAPK